MPLIQQLIKKQTRHWDSKLVSDPVQDKLLEIIEAKRKETKRPAKAKVAEPKATPDNVINIMAALRRSVEAEKRPGTIEGIDRRMDGAERRRLHFRVSRPSVSRRIAMRRRRAARGRRYALRAAAAPDRKVPPRQGSS
jgi:hypothetical protein